MRDSVRHHIDDLGERVEEFEERVVAAIEEVKPKLRGWLHAVNAPLTLAAGVVLIALSPTAATRVGSTIYAISALLLFSISAAFHRGHWTPKVQAFLRRFDHANIFMLIAGSYTPFTLLLLKGNDRVIMLTVIWVGAALGGLFRVFWLSAPRWLYVAIYLVLGWAAIFFVNSYIDGALELGKLGVAAIILAAVGGLFYTVGAVVYGFKWPNPSPRWFGFHEVFHSFTILAFISQYVGVSLATYSLR